MKKLNNKGFSLVELIIVIAIMAILVGVVGTQVIPYLESSRKAKDIQILSAWNTAAMSAYSSAAASLDSTAVYKITINDASAGSVSGGATAEQNALKAQFEALSGVTGLNYDFGTKMESKAGKDIQKVEITINGSTGAIGLTVTNEHSGTYSFDPIENK